MRFEMTKEKKKRGKSGKRLTLALSGNCLVSIVPLTFFRDPSRFLFLRFSVCFLARVSLTFNHSSLLYLAVPILSLFVLV